MSKPEQKRNCLISLVSNIANVKVSGEVCSIFVQVLLRESCREASSRLVMKCLESSPVPCVGATGNPKVPGKGGWCLARSYGCSTGWRLNLCEE